MWCCIPGQDSYRGQENVTKSLREELATLNFEPVSREESKRFGQYYGQIFNIAENGDFAFVKSPSFEKDLFLHISDVLTPDPPVFEKDMAVLFDSVRQATKGPKVVNATLSSQT